ncbi:hypothetical protein [Streptomyces acidicola]|uniref:hypothetical protein n=1 Tax=Streptomyces acidicola TaxID=2596892 RepID=UPI003439EDCA
MIVESGRAAVLPLAEQRGCSSEMRRWLMIRHKPRSRGSGFGSLALATVLEVDLPVLPPGAYPALDEQPSDAPSVATGRTPSQKSLVTGSGSLDVSP